VVLGVRVGEEQAWGASPGSALRLTEAMCRCAGGRGWFLSGYQLSLLSVKARSRSHCIVSFSFFIIRSFHLNLASLEGQVKEK
jgi:hypothetical protein